MSSWRTRLIRHIAGWTKGGENIEQHNKRQHTNTSISRSPRNGCQSRGKSNYDALFTLHHICELIGGDLIWFRSESDWPQIRQIRDFFRSDSVKMYWNLIWKSLGFVPFRVNLTQFGPKSDLTPFELIVIHKYLARLAPHIIRADTALLKINCLYFIVMRYQDVRLAPNGRNPCFYPADNSEYFARWAKKTCLWMSYHYHLYWTASKSWVNQACKQTDSWESQTANNTFIALCSETRKPRPDL